MRTDRQDVLDEELVVGEVRPDLALLPLHAKPAELRRRVIEHHRIALRIERLLREVISLGYPGEHLQPTPNSPGDRPLAQRVDWDRY